jgi:hypothetical protein
VLLALVQLRRLAGGALMNGHGGRRVGAGRPPGVTNIRSVQDRLEIEMAFRETFKGQAHADKTPSFHITRLLLRRALAGDTAACIHLDERYHGRVKYTMELEGSQEKPLEHHIYEAVLDDGLPAIPLPAPAETAVAPGNGGKPTNGARRRR